MGGREGGRGQGLFHALSLMVKFFGLHCIIVVVIVNLFSVITSLIMLV